MAKQLRLEKVRRNRRGIERDKRLAGARAVVVQRTRDDLLAGARLPGDEHRDARAGSRPMARNTCCIAGAGRAAAECAAPAPRSMCALRRARRAPHEIDRMVDVEGLGQILERTAAIGGYRVAQIRMRRHHDDGQSGARFVNPLQELESGLARHADIGDQYVRALVRNAASAGSAASKVRGGMPPSRSARSRTQRIDASSSTSQTRSAAVH